MYVKLYGLELLMIQSPLSRVVQVRMRYLNVDNNSSYELQYPVVFSATNFNIMMKDPNRFLINLLIEQNL